MDFFTNLVIVVRMCVRGLPLRCSASLTVEGERGVVQELSTYIRYFFMNNNRVNIG